jgi:hypothetical protein
VHHVQYLLNNWYVFVCFVINATDKVCFYFYKVCSCNTKCVKFKPGKNAQKILQKTLRYSSRDGHAEGEHVNRGRDTPSFCPTLQVLDSSFLLCLSWLLRIRFRKFRRDLRITPYSYVMCLSPQIVT